MLELFEVWLAERFIARKDLQTRVVGCEPQMAAARKRRQFLRPIDRRKDGDTHPEEFLRWLADENARIVGVDVENPKWPPDERQAAQNFGRKSDAKLAGDFGAVGFAETVGDDLAAVFVETSVVNVDFALSVKRVSSLVFARAVIFEELRLSGDLMPNTLQKVSMRIFVVC